MKTQFIPFSRLLLVTALLVACGGGGGGSSNSSNPSSGNGGAPTVALVINQFEAAQTHVMPEAGLQWKKSDGSEMGALHLTAQRDTMVMFDLGSATPISPMVEASQAGVKLGAVALTAPAQLPGTEGGGAAYASNRYSATLPAAWVTPGVQLRVSAQNYLPSDYKQPSVGADIDFNMYVLPMYLYGATEANTQPYSVTSNADQATRDELYAKWPVSRLNIRTAPAGRIDWAYIIIEPRSDAAQAKQAAYRANTKSDEKDSYATMSAALNTLHAIINANGDNMTNMQMYAPLLMLDATGKYADPGGGLGGNHVGSGDYRYAGVFIHEQGHAFGMPHAKDGYAASNYPYVNGSLLGSSWGFDIKRQQFLAPYVSSASKRAATCATDGVHVMDAANRCAKQDLMQSGSGDQTPDYKFTMHSDFNAGVIQRYFEGTTTLNANGTHSYSGGRIFVDANAATGYSRWDSIDKKRVAYTPSLDANKGLYGIDGNLPRQRDVAVHTIILTLSYAGTANVTQIYPALSYNGNLVKTIDPTDAAQRALVVPNTGTYPWYCHGTGCDYTLRVTYADGSVSHTMLQAGARAWFSPTGAAPANKLDPLNASSYKVMGVNVPGDKALAKVELLNTPMAWNGIDANAAIVASRNFP